MATGSREAALWLLPAQVGRWTGQGSWEPGKELASMGLGPPCTASRLAKGSYLRPRPHLAPRLCASPGTVTGTDVGTGRAKQDRWVQTEGGQQGAHRA